MKRVFFDWARPFLSNVAETLVANELRRTPRTLDFGDAVFILPGSRANRTLESRLQRVVEREISAGNAAPDWTPPRYLTVGAALETLYVPRRRVASRPTRLLCQAQAIENFAAKEPEKTRRLLKSVPPATNLTARLELAEIFLRLADELAAERRDFRAVAASTRRRGLADETERWATLEEIDELYRAELDKIDMTDVNIARKLALRRGDVGKTNDGARRYFVVGAVDLKDIQKTFFKTIADRVEFFVFAPESEGAKFDEFGCVLPEAWENALLPIPDERLFQVDSPSNQARAAVYLTAELSKKYDEDGAWEYDPIPPEELTVGVPDSQVVPFLEKEFRDVGYETRRAQEAPATQNRVFQLLRNVADYLETRSFSALEELARRPDFEDFLNENWKFVSLPKDDAPENADGTSEVEFAPGSLLDGATNAEPFVKNFDETREDADSESSKNADAPSAFVPGDWLSDFARYRATFLPTRVDGRWFEYKNDDAPRQNAQFRLLRKVALLVERVLEPFCDAEEPKVRREELAVSATRSNAGVAAASDEIDALKLSETEIDAARNAVFSGEFEFAKDNFFERFRWTTNQRRRPPRDWAPILSEFLCRIYPDSPSPASAAGRSPEATAQIDAFFKAFNDKLNEIEEIPPGLAGETTGSAAIRVLLKELAGASIPPAPNDRAVELVGWLELPFDDAPNLILTGFNEGIVPSSKSNDLFLPNDMRSELGLDDARRLFARDVYLTTALARSKRNLFAVFGRRSLQNDPLKPSRFAFATDPEKVPDRICRFFAANGSGDLDRLAERQENRPFSAKKTTETAAPETSPIPRAEIGFRPPILRLPGLAPTKMRVTEFRDFLACPYRYFLKYALKLRAVPEPSAEMGAASFGTLAHAALREFGSDPKIRDSVDADEISAWLSDRLDAVARRSFNELTSPFVRIQIEQIRFRLDAFSRWQANWRRSGRRVEYVEASPASGSIRFDVGGSPVEIFGRLDRIDYDPKENRWFVFDYKTFESGNAESEAKGKAKSEAPIHSENEPPLCDDVKDDAGTVLFSTKIGNVVDKKHRRKAKPRRSAPNQTLEKHGVATSEEIGSNDAPAFDWIDLQLPLYRRFFRQILFERYEGRRAWADVESAKVSLGYVVLTKDGKTQAFGAPWSERDLRAADATASRVVRTIRRLWSADVNPDVYIDPDDPSLGTILATNAPAFSEEFSPITLDFLQ